MCGIIGVFGKNDPEGRAVQSLEKITHRGSSSYELKSFPHAVIGANRLPIVDREGGQQPKTNEDETIFAVQNGEIFNYRELQEELKEKGHAFKSDSDTEVLAHLYEEYREKMLEKLDSEMFAFVIYDSKNDTVFAARDPLGVKPLYYAYDSIGQLYFASELKQLAFYDDIQEIHTFLPGHYWKDGQLEKYTRLEISNDLKEEGKALQILETDIVEAVRKRVQTDLPIGVFLSGGVDSSLIMEIASRFHPDVTAIILGFPGSSDYEFALRLCKERNYKYHIVRPEVDFEKELDDLIYHLETYEPLIIRQSFALDLCAKAAERLGLRVVLVGEGSDELFAGYNEFASLPNSLINKGCQLLTESLHPGHLQRVDRMSMRHTIEVRAPFFDQKVVKTALSIDGKLKLYRENHQITTKYILRKVASRFLPEYIAWRYKVPFSNGAGMNVGNNYKTEDGDIAKIAAKRATETNSSLREKYQVNTKEGEYYLAKFHEANFDKLTGSEKRLVVKDTLSDLHKSDMTRLIVAEFDRLALYFPLYYAAENGSFKLHNLDVDFIATGGDDRTYQSLVNNSAHIGLSDPLFAMFENETGVKGEIIGELVKRIPCMAVTINPAVKIESLEDFAQYRIGTFQKFTTTHSIARYFLPPETSLSPYDYKELEQKLTNREIDIALVLPEQALELCSLGGRIVYEFQNQKQGFLFSGFTISTYLEEKYREALKPFLAAMREATRALLKDNDNALTYFKKLFPHYKNPEKIFEYHKALWSTTLEVDKAGYMQARRMWEKNYPGLLKQYRPIFTLRSPADPILACLKARKFRKDFPFLEDVLAKKIERHLAADRLLDFIGFWGAGEKSHIDDSDIQTLDYFSEYIESIKETFKPGVRVTFFLSDAHARNNGYEETNIQSYLRDVKMEMAKRGFQAILLSELWQRWGITPEKIIEDLKDKSANWWSEITLAKKLEERADKHFQGGDEKLGAQKYYIMRTMENKFIEQDFRNSIFFAFTDGFMQPVYPALPTVYLYTTGRGESALPWFPPSGRLEICKEMK